MNIKKYFRQVPLFFFVALLGLSVNANATNIGTDAVVLTAVTVTAGADLDFGTFSTNGLAETISFPSDTGTIAAGGNVVLLGGEVTGTATLDTSGTANALVTVTLTATTLTGGGGPPMVLTPDCTGPTAGIGTNVCTFTSVSASSPETVQVGGSLAVNAAQTGGTYTGTIDVIAGF